MQLLNNLYTNKLILFNVKGGEKMNHLFKKNKTREDVSGYACYCVCGLSCMQDCSGGCDGGCWGFCNNLVW